MGISRAKLDFIPEFQNGGRSDQKLESTVIFMLTLTHSFGTDIQWQNVDPSLMNEALLGINSV